MLILGYMGKCAPIGIHREMCSHWIALYDVLLLEYMKKMCSHWIVLHNVLILGYMGKCAPIGIHREMCSDWVTLHHVLISECMKKIAPDNGMPESDFTTTAKYTLVESRNEICIQFHFLAKVLLLTCITAHVCSY